MTVTDRMLATGLVSVALLAVAALSTQTTSQVSALLDENWRGAYDILVTPAGGSFDEAQTGGLVDPAFISTAGDGGISLSQLEQIREIAGVDVAAPVGMVGIVRNQSIAPAIWVDTAADGYTSSNPMIASIAMTLEDMRSAENKAIARHHGTVLLPDLDSLDPMVDPGQGTPIGFSPLATDSGVYIPLGNLPEFASPVIAVDPGAEVALAGDSRESPVSALLSLPDDRSAAVSGEEWSALVDPEAFITSWSSLLNAAIDESSAMIIPLVVADVEPGVLRMTVEIATADLPASQYPEPGAMANLDEILDGSDLRELDVIEIDASTVVAPFSSSGIIATWPGSAPHDDGAGGFFLPATSLSPALVGRPAYEPMAGPFSTEVSMPHFQVEPLGVVDAAGMQLDPEVQALSGAEEYAGAVQSYRSLDQTRGGEGDNVIPAPVGTFKPTEIYDTDVDSLSYVPSGVQPIETRTLDDGALVWSNFSTVDFITANVGAFTDLTGAQVLRGETPIDAIRVKVAGLTGYNQQGWAQVDSVARQIANLGLTVTIVAGSSPTQVGVNVPEYTVSGNGTTSDLGWTIQEWTSLGAVFAVQSGISGSSGVLVVMAMAAAGLGMVITTFQKARSRRGEVAVLRLVGWREGAIKTRVFRGEILPAAVVVAVAASSLLWADPSLRAPVLMLVVLVCAIAGTAPFIATTLRQSGPANTSKAAPVTTMAGWARRRVFAAPLTFGLTVSGAALMPLLIGFTVGSALEHLARLGDSRLATAAGDIALFSIWTLGLIGAGVGVLLIAIARRIETRQRTRTDNLLNELGIPTRVRRSLRRREDAILSGGALIVGIMVLMSLLVADLPPLALAAAGAGSLLALLARVPAYTKEAE